MFAGTAVLDRFPRPVVDVLADESSWEISLVLVDIWRLVNV
jgi:hypothetical protein